MGPLISVEAYATRLGRALEGAEAAQVAAFIDDASALIRDEAGEDFLDENNQPAVPASVAAVACQVVRRAMENPRALTGESLGDYSWQANGSGATGLELTRSEKRIIRRAVGKLSVSALQLQGDLPVPGAFDMNTLTWT